MAGGRSIVDYTKRTSAVDRQTYHRFEDQELASFFKGYTSEKCPGCASPLELVCHIRRPITPFELAGIRLRKPDTEPYWVEIKTFSCGVCGWWRVANEQSPINVVDYIFPSIAAIDACDPELSTEVLSAEFSRNPSIINHVNPTVTEKFVADVLREHVDSEIIHVGRTGDGGIDLFYAAGEKRFAFQVKRRSRENATEGVQLIREFLGAMLLNQYDGGAVVSMAKRFTRGALSEANQAIEMNLVEKFDLVDRQRFIELFQFNSKIAKSPWEIVFKDVAERSSMDAPYEMVLNKSGLAQQQG